MPYRRYYKRGSNRGKLRYKKKTFTRFNTYKNRSSKAQAYQIYKLNKKINYVYKMNKPETQIYQNDDTTIETGVYTDTLSGRVFNMHRCIDHGLDVFNGRIAKIKNVVFTGDFKFGGNPGETSQGAVGCLRLIFFRTKYQIWGLPNVIDVLPYDVADYTNEYFMKCPLQRGFSTKYILVKDYKFYLFPQKSSIKFVNIKLKYPYSLKRAEEMNSDNHEDNAFPANSLFCVSYICRAGASPDTDTFTTDLFMKLAYTDDTPTVQPGDNNRNITSDIEEDKK